MNLQYNFQKMIVNVNIHMGYGLIGEANSENKH